MGPERLGDRGPPVGAAAGARRRADRRGGDDPRRGVRALRARGLGTPAPIAPTERLVVGGAYRYVRNPMYLAVGATILGQALVLGSGLLAGYLVLFAVTVYAFVRLYEEPELGRTYGPEYEAYRRAVRGWLPRLRPWRGPRTPPSRSR